MVCRHASRAEACRVSPQRRLNHGPPRRTAHLRQLTSQLRYGLKQVQRQADSAEPFRTTKIGPLLT